MNIFYSQPYLELAMVLVELILTVQMKSQQQFGYDHISEFVPNNSFVFEIRTFIQSYQKLQQLIQAIHW